MSSTTMHAAMHFSVTMFIELTAQVPTLQSLQQYKVQSAVSA